MATKNYYEGVQQVVYITTNILKSCDHCNEQIGLDNLAGSINHYIQQHDYKLLHVGTETDRDMNGHLCHSTVAVLGK